MKIALIACSKTKRSVPCPARELYAPSRLFRLSYRYGKQMADQVWILSAKYGLLAEEQVVAPYDLTLSDLPQERQRDWAGYVLKQMEARFDLSRDTFLILAGRCYYQNLLPRLGDVRLPLGNLPLGARMAFLERALAGMENVPVQLETAGCPCLQLHRMLAGLRRYAWDEIAALPFRDGIYLVYEQGETYHGMPRIVRVGTHTAPGRLRQRLRDHFVKEDRNSSIFRKNIGKALLNRDHDPYLSIWTLDTSRPPYQGRELPAKAAEKSRRSAAICAPG